jgi:ATP-dependent Clp protease ATP-binding subunit ClpC
VLLVHRLSIPFIAITWTLENDAQFGRALFHPEVSRLAADPRAMLRVLASAVRESAGGDDLLALHRRVPPPAGAITTTPFDLEIEPPSPSEQWYRPVTLALHLVHWTDPGSGLKCGAIPELDIEVHTRDPAPDALPALARREALRALVRSDALRSLEPLVMLSRFGPLTVERGQARADIVPTLDRILERERGKEAALDALPAVGRRLQPTRAPIAFQADETVSRLGDALSGQAPRAALLIGPAGVGKTAAAHELTRRLSDFDLGAHSLWEISGAAIVAGASGFGAWQQRCEQIMREAQAHNAILHLGNLVELLHVGKSEHNDRGVAHFLRPAIVRGDLRVIAECTPEQAALIDAQDPRLIEAFRRVDVDPPTVARSRAILLDAAFGQDQRAAGGEHGPAEATPGPDVDPLTLDAVDFIDRLHRRYAPYSAFPGRSIRFLRKLLGEREPAQTLTPADVSRLFSKETGLPAAIIDPDTLLDVAATYDWFNRRVIGQPEAVEWVVELLAAVRAQLTRPRKPIASLLFIGPTGVGKTEMAKALAEYLFADRRRISRFDMSEFGDPYAVQRLTGGAGSHEGVLTAAVRETPFSVVLFDEFEKAHPLFFDLLLQVLGEGRLTDASGRVADFCNTLVVMTSNLGAESFRQGGIGFAGDDDDAGRRNAADHFQAEVRRFLRPEMVGRLDAIVPFQPLGPAALREVLARELRLAREREGITYRDVTLTIDDDVVGHLAATGTDPRYGARPLKRAVEQQVLVPLAAELNDYPDDVPLAARVSLAADGSRIEPTVRGRDDDDAAGADAADPADVAGRISECRRRCQRLGQSPAVHSLHNDIFRLRSHKQRLDRKLRAGRSVGHEYAVIERLSGDEKVADRLAAQIDTVCRLEDDALLTLYGAAAHAPAELANRLAAVDAGFDGLLDALLRRRYDNPDRLVIGVYGRGEWFAAIVSAYRRVAESLRDGKAELWEVRRWRAGDDVGEAGVGVPGGDAPADGEATAADDRDSPRVTVRRYDDPPARLAAAHPDRLGVVLDLSGDLIEPRLVQEAGRHEIRTGSERVNVLVDTHSGSRATYTVPAQAAPRDGDVGSGMPRRRLFDLPAGVTVDEGPAGRRRQRWEGPPAEMWRLIRDLSQDCLAALRRSMTE